MQSAPASSIGPLDRFVAGGPRADGVKGRPLAPASSPPPYINQLRPAGAPTGYDGEANCGPTCMSMIARATQRKRGLSDAGLVSWFAEIGRTTHEDGTEIEGMRSMAKAMGWQVEDRPGADIDWLTHQLETGHLVIALGEYYAMPPHEDASQREGHYVLVHGLTPSGAFAVHDPYDPAVARTGRGDMRRFLAEHDKGGHLIAISSQADLPMSAKEQLLLRSSQRAISPA